MDFGVQGVESRVASMAEVHAYLFSAEAETEGLGRWTLECFVGLGLDLSRSPAPLHVPQCSYSHPLFLDQKVLAGCFPSKVKT